MEYRAKLNSLDVILRYSINKIVRRYSIDGTVSRMTQKMCDLSENEVTE